MVLIWIIVLQILVFVVLAYFLKVTLSKNVSQATSHLSEINQDFNQKLEEANKKKAEVEKYYDDIMIKTKSEAEKAKMQILREAHDTREEMIREARKQSAEIIEQANRSRESILAEIDEQVDARGLERAWEMASAVLPAEISQSMHEQWVDALFQDEAQGLERLRLPENLQSAEVVTAYPLTPKQREAITRMLRQKAGRELSLTETVSTELVAGFKLVLGSVVLDGSLENRMKEWIRRARATKV